ncbi:MAG: ABC transporter substrate-binding protein [Burkholderiales bacterium]
MTSRRNFLGALAGSALTWPSVAESQSAAKVPVLGVLVTDLSRNISTSILLQGLRDIGYVDGSNIVIAIRSAEGMPALLPARAAELVNLKPDVIYATGPAAIRAAWEATRSIPIVALDLESNPVSAGWARSFARPGGNLTGLFLDHPGIATKWLELIKAVAPASRRVGLVWDPGTGPAQLMAAQAVAPKFAFETTVIEIRSKDELETSLAAGVKAGARALVMLSSPLVSTSAPELAGFAAKNRVPMISPFRRFAEAGGLMAYGPDFDDFRRRSASYIDKILKGAKPGNLPIEQPTKFEFVINLKTAKALGLTIPASVLAAANELIQ